MAASDGPEDEDDYLSMTFTNDATTAPETSLQRRQRLKREGEIRGRPKSKEELAAEEAAAREAALSTSMLASKSKGLLMMRKMGFKAGQALGSKDNDYASKEPIRPSLKEDRAGIGMDAERKRKLDEAAERDGLPKVPKIDPDDFRDRVRREREVARWERQVGAAQKVVERFDEERVAEGQTPSANGAEPESQKKRTISSRPLKSINVLYRGLVRRREEADRDRRMRYDLEQSLSRLPTYEDETEDADDKMALGYRNDRAKKEYIPVEDLEEEDEELDEFNALEPDEKLRRLVSYLREKYWYCFWCKFRYDDKEMEGCPGLTEEDHD
jgi:hypothetical protein